MTIRISAELSHICPLEGIRFHAEALASCGYYRVWAPDTLVSQWEAWLAASVILHATDRLRIGVGVMNPYTRHPVLMAQMGAFMQHLSNGRLALSIGKGIPRFLEKAGIQPHETAVNEAITIVRRLMSGQRTSHSGDAYTIDGLRLRVHPPQKQVPIYRAAVSLDGWKDAME